MPNGTISKRGRETCMSQVSCVVRGTHQSPMFLRHKGERGTPVFRLRGGSCFRARAAISLLVTVWNADGDACMLSLGWCCPLAHGFFFFWSESFTATLVLCNYYYNNLSKLLNLPDPREHYDSNIWASLQKRGKNMCKLHNPFKKQKRSSLSSKSHAGQSKYSQLIHYTEEESWAENTSPFGQSAAPFFPLQKQADMCAGKGSKQAGGRLISTLYSFRGRMETQSLKPQTLWNQIS